MEKKYIATIINELILKIKNKPIVKFNDEIGNVITGKVNNMDCSWWCKGQNIYVEYKDNKIYSEENTSDILKRENRKEKNFMIINFLITLLLIIFCIYKFIITLQEKYIFLIFGIVLIANIITIILIVKMSKKDVEKIENYSKMVEGKVVAIKPIARTVRNNDKIITEYRDWRYMYEYNVLGNTFYGIESYLDPLLYDNYKIGSNIYIMYDEQNPLNSCFKDVYEWKKNGKQIELQHDMSPKRKLTQGIIVNIITKKIDAKNELNLDIYNEEWIECEYIVGGLKYHSTAKFAYDIGTFNIGDKVQISYTENDPNVFWV